MAITTKFIARNTVNKYQGSFLIRPMLAALFLGGISESLSSFEEANPWIGKAMPHFFLLPSTNDPQVAQIILSDIATAMMTVVSIVFAVMLMTLTLASTQFSPRIMIAFVRDRITQVTLGFFLGTFLYCLAALASTRTSPVPFSPAVTVLFAMVLAIVCVAFLLIFINHISKAVNVNFIVHKIARETESMIGTTMPDRSDIIKNEAFHKIDMENAESEILSHVSGYVRYIDAERLFLFAKRNNVSINVTRRVGHFVPEGIPLLTISKMTLTPELTSELREAFDLGPTRTLENDIEFGILQIVDIALKAISPAVNDPSTAITCIDQLSSILIRFGTRGNPQTMFYSSPGNLCLSIPWLGFDRLVESAFEQIRLYSQSDIAVSLRLLRALNDIATTLPAGRSKSMLLEFGRLLVDGCTEKLGNEELREMKARIASLEKLVA